MLTLTLSVQLAVFKHMTLGWGGGGGIVKQMKTHIEQMLGPRMNPIMHVRDLETRAQLIFRMVHGKQSIFRSSLSGAVYPRTVVRDHKQQAQA